MSSGIYEIRNIVNNNFYIGSAVKLNKRFNTHKCLLRKNKHHNQHLQNAWNKYGEESFQFNTLKNCNKEELIQIEQEFINALNPKYNICKIAESRLGIKQSEETKEKIRLTKLGAKYPNRKSPEFTEEHKKNISKSLSGKEKSESHILKMKDSAKRRKDINIQNIKKAHNKNKKPLLQFSKRGILIQEWESTVIVEEKLRISNADISKVCRNLRKSAGGFIWRYKD